MFVDPSISQDLKTTIHKNFLGEILIFVFLNLIRFPVVSMGLLKWVSECMAEKNYAKVITESSPLQIVMLDEVCERCCSCITCFMYKKMKFSVKVFFIKCEHICSFLKGFRISRLIFTDRFQKKKKSFLEIPFSFLETKTQYCKCARVPA